MTLQTLFSHQHLKPSPRFARHLAAQLHFFCPQRIRDCKEWLMKLHSSKFVYNAINAVASGKLDRETEEGLSRAIEAELAAIAAHLPAEASMEIAV